MNAASRRSQAGVTLLVVLLVLAVMLLGGLMFARSTLVGALMAGNHTYVEASTHANDVGVSTAFEELLSLTSTETAAAWYSPVPLGDDTRGLPNVADWQAAHSVGVGPYETRYVIERLCNTVTVTDAANQCLLHENPNPFRDAGEAPIPTPALRNYRVTVRVTGPRNTLTWAQALLSRP